MKPQPPPGPLTPALPHVAPQGLVVQQFFNRRAHGLLILVRHDPAAFAMADDLPDATAIHSDNGQTRRHGLRENNAKGLRQGGKHKNGARIQARRDS